MHVRRTCFSQGDIVIKITISRSTGSRGLICTRTVVFTRVTLGAIQNTTHHFLIVLERHSPALPGPHRPFTVGKQRPVSIFICSHRYFSVSPPTPRGGCLWPAFSLFISRITRVCWSRGPVRITQKYSRADKAAGSLIRKLIERRGTLVGLLTSKLLTTTTTTITIIRPSPSPTTIRAGAARDCAEIVQIFEPISRGFNRRKLPSLYPKSISLSPISSISIKFPHNNAIGVTYSVVPYTNRIKNVWISGNVALSTKEQYFFEFFHKVQKDSL